MEQQLQIIALGLWALIGIASGFSFWNLANMADTDANLKAAKTRSSIAWSLQAILGLMLIQTLGLTV
jgi:hypothetical protein